MAVINGLSINIPGATWDAECIIGSRYPQAAFASLATYGTQNGRTIMGASPVAVGAPVQHDYYFTGDANTGGYDLKVTDNIKKTEMVLIRPSAVRSLGMGNYLGGDVVPQGDTFVFEPAIGRLRAVVGRTAGTAESRLDVAMDTGKFHLAFFDVSGEAVQVHKMVSGQLVSGALTAVTARAIPSPAKPIMVARANNTMTDFLGSVDIAMTGVWSGTNLTAAQKQDMCNVIMEMYGDILPLA
ncbi:Uncharacterised protein [Klebsiella pneumoniae]|uniref:hypothetical protein n=1 Tax=Klebsiella pneumoniae TaxID=573 RepID=UPI0007CBFC9F|nr:hypothetical protein [Klebsiella pneumoniae]SBG54083.1 Uncharacterised protein [Klebsiella pneumoniae]SBJ78115.1 Uncharacterised protein [Klebsiella pneumoniae]HBY9515468.1 hypothetical protein [Klebsiella pneumoniae]HBY9536135.1 hypothetical protein [Klebsiella pneumoniae]